MRGEEIGVDVRGAGRPLEADNLAEELHGAARDKTPVPGSGLLPGDYPCPEGVDLLNWSVAIGEQTAGRTYRARVAAAAAQH
ncbi:hypothetical protein [Rhodococcus sp. ARC_M6]|uniref:hypothetical protein n=1 Tax=Rhodococcus sp. ARC_M6 TaxID=2928852 RepID=UPI001FB54908|nr:hypothetical protein [Rhodococcus sp. ARC_M6]MCJ0907121.1 hypothetical protein [Rhodococcus sp. ARC_M6]